MGRRIRIDFGQFLDELGNLFDAGNGNVYVDDVTGEVFAIDASGNKIPMTSRVDSTDTSLARTDQLEPVDSTTADGAESLPPGDAPTTTTKPSGPSAAALPDGIADAEWREIDSAAMSDATKADLSKKGIDWRKIAAVATGVAGAGGLITLVYRMDDGTVVDGSGNPVGPSGGGTNPNGIRPDDDPGGIGERGRGGGGTTSGGGSTGASSGGSGGGSGSSYGAGQSSGGSSSSGGNYPTLPMTDIRRMILTNISAANGGRPMGGFPTPPGGWDPRMESMFTTGAFEPQQASQEQVDAYNNKPRPSLPTPPWKKQQSQGAPSMPNPVVRNQGVPSYTDMMAKLQGNAASKSKPASAPAAGTKPSFPSVGMQPNAQQRTPFSPRPEGGYSFDGAPFPPGYAEKPDSYAQRLAQAGFPSGYQPLPSTGMGMPAMGAAPAATAKPLTYQEMLAKIQGK